MGQTYVDDNNLIAAFKRGNAEAFRTLYNNHKDSAYFYALALAKNPHAAEDAAQEAFLTFIRNVPRYKPTGSFRSYILSVVRSRVIDAARKAKGKRIAITTGEFDLFEAPTLIDPDQGDMTLIPFRCYTDGIEDRFPRPGEVADALAGLPIEQREIVVLKVFEEMTFREIAAVAGISKNTAASRYRYACEKLRSRLMGYIRNG